MHQEWQKNREKLMQNSKAEKIKKQEREKLHRDLQNRLQMRSEEAVRINATPAPLNDIRPEAAQAHVANGEVTLEPLLARGSTLGLFSFRSPRVDPHLASESIVDSFQ